MNAAQHASVQAAETQCYHCGSDIPPGSHFYTRINDEDRRMCCPGCQAVAQTIVEGGLDNFYRHRGTELSPSSADLAELEALTEELALYDNREIQQGFVNNIDSDQPSATLVIEGISCAACVWLLENHLGKQPGVVEFTVNLTNHRAKLIWQSDSVRLSQLLAEVARIGYKAHPYHPDKEEQLLAQESKRSIIRLGVAGIGSMQAMMFAAAIYAADIAGTGMDDKYVMLMRWASMVVSTPVILYASLPFLRNAIRDIRARHLTMDIPVSIAIWGGYVASVWATVFNTGEIYFESVTMFAFFLLIGRFMEMKARQRTGRAGNALLNLIPASAMRINDHGEEELVPASSLQPGDRIRIKPGQTIPADGVIVRGFSSVDESALTGEYMPVSKKVKDTLVGGTINIENPVEMQVTVVGENSRISSIVRLLDRAQSEKPYVARVADHVARYFVGATLVVAACVSTAWYFIEPANAFWITLAVLVVTCPCALSLATPTALTAATGTLRQQGLLITRGHVLESFSKATHIIFDKTGTLTEGRLAIQETCPLNGTSAADALTWGAALEALSEHPIGRAFTPWYCYTADDIENTVGKGIEGGIEGKRFRIGAPEYVMELSGQALPNLPDNKRQWILLGNETGALAWFALDDQIRRETRQAIQSLKKLGLSVEILTGDTSPAVQRIAEKLDIQVVNSGMNPEQKLARIHQLQSEGKQTIMVGDGINDIPVLVGAQTSVSMGAATDLAKTNADAVLTNNNLQTLADSILMARKTRTIIKENLGLSLAYNVLALPAAAMGLVPPYIAAIGMTASSLVVTGNAMRLIRAPRKPAQQVATPSEQPANINAGT
ncbi:Type cbb3 cytochrome oxidase biogenesis protein CcoI [Nitrincola lacisaponensis]|uniref:Type cbb3 cytochrome oxidase biogenesis protein CcoI n=1 Tax=Nitrincola lacisaponensis TaxID=267850 RepID=A0A063XWG1_9GAMM|nr:heavy metal translocating P-type ATPase [Nitrincola lacisaponensis]KDE38543.1 Type cbb3 cytochrome oxidase biogenesis protein CcoI [Nitrincola lacisaponensis]